MKLVISVGTASARPKVGTAEGQRTLRQQFLYGNVNLSPPIFGRAEAVPTSRCRWRWLVVFAEG